MKINKQLQLKMPVGYFHFHDDIGLNFQFNRALINQCPMDEMMEAAQRISKYSDVKKVMKDLAEKALSEGRTLNAAFYYRFAEFFCFSDKDEKKRLYDVFITLFYKALERDNIERHEIKYDNGFLKAIRVECNYQKKGTVVVHGGGDSFIEEFYLSVRGLVNEGFEVILFEGPGQGEPLQKYNLKMTHEWEKPTKEILDYYKLDNVTLIGISLGGYFALRAAAFEKRIKRVVAWDVVYDFFKCITGREGMLKYHLVNLLVSLNIKCLVNAIARRQMKDKDIEKWIYNQMMYAYGVDTIFDYMKTLKRYNTKNISQMITQDVLLLAGSEDHIIPLRMYELQYNALKNSRSVEGRIFKREEHASNHCQVGNINLALNYIIDWIKKKSKSIE
ncbi:MAG: alpha/beta hydrolase family protein [Acetivibrionales bacterium]|jgi:pimeloyl-ACP methyl ester carboxylesterase